MNAHMPRHLAFVASAIALLVLFPTAAARAALIDRQTLLDWGTDVYNQTVLTLGIPGAAEFAETASISGSR